MPEHTWDTKWVTLASCAVKSTNFNWSSNEFFCYSAAVLQGGPMFLLKCCSHYLFSCISGAVALLRSLPKIWCIVWICSYVIRYDKEATLFYPREYVTTITEKVWQEQFWVKQSEMWNQLQISNTQMLLHCSSHRKATHQGCKLGKRDCCESYIYTSCCGSLFNYLRKTCYHQSSPKKDSRLFRTPWTKQVPSLVQREATVMLCRTFLN